MPFEIHIYIYIESEEAAEQHVSVDERISQEEEGHVPAQFSIILGGCKGTVTRVGADGSGHVAYWINPFVFL